ncbi:MAG TPA: hypothetical protein VLY03_07180 [Bacteroidota bacterium]|nr:hypothetical protein [Bacteroidota bacterium]
MKTCGALLATFLVVVPGPAQVLTSGQHTREVSQSIYGLGLSAGVASGFGLSFRHHLPGFFSYQIVGGVIKVDNKTDYNIGGEVQFDMTRGDRSRFFADASTGYFYSGDGGNTLAGPYRLGLGLGWEWGNFDPMNMSAELLFTYFSDGTILPLPQVAIHYYFF